MGRKNLSKKAFKETNGFLEGNAHALSLRKVGGKWVADIALMKSMNGYTSAGETLAMNLEATLKKHTMSSDVRITTFEPGERPANLADPEANRRSVAAILARKYRLEAQKLSHFYSAMRKRELRTEEIEAIFKIIEGLGIKL